MELILDDEEIKEVTLDDFINKTDKTKITIVGENHGKRGESKDEIIKEIIANDAIVLGSSKAAELHGISQPSASKYSNGLDVSEETRERVLAKKYDIADAATAKLMNALNLFEPSDIEKPLDKIRAASMLANIVEKVSSNSKHGEGGIHLHLYAPKQNDLKKYEVIDV